MLTREQTRKFNAIIDEMGASLDISETEFDNAVKSYEAVGKQLSKSGSLLQPYDPEILPQGSFMIGTMIKPINKNDDLDIDLVCQLRNKPYSWTQYTLKEQVRTQLEENDVYRKLLQHPDGKRCWTLRYREGSERGNYHMDILPCIVDTGYRIMLEKAFSNYEMSAVEQLAIRITDKTRLDYTSEKDHQQWLKSNPFGYAKWFFSRASLGAQTRLYSLNEAVRPVPKFQTAKFPLQRVVQILKRHRDIKFARPQDKDDKPISIIITTLASQAYKGETDVIMALQNVVRDMHLYIEDVREPSGRIVKWVRNPANTVENFADKWAQHPNRQIKFLNWLAEVNRDIERATKAGSDQLIMESLEQPFGSDLVKAAFDSLAGRSIVSPTTRFMSGTLPKDITAELPSRPPQTKREGFQ